MTSERVVYLGPFSGPSGLGGDVAGDQSTSLLLVDEFADELPRGAVIGTASSTGQLRLGVDREGCLGIDLGALRLAAPEVPGWRRHALSYGPLTAQVNDCAAFLLLNGHHGSQTRRVYSGRLRSFMRSWATGSIRRFLVTGPWRGGARRLGRIAPTSAHDLTVPVHRTSLRIGWFAAPDRPRLNELPSFSVAAAGVRNGDLRVRTHGRDLTVVEGITNTPLCLVILRCHHGTTYLAGGMVDAFGVPAYPELRPVAFIPGGPTSKAYLGLHQSVLGEVGFNQDTRLYGVRHGSWGGCCCERPLTAESSGVSGTSVSTANDPGCLSVPLPDQVPTWLRFRQTGSADYWEVRFDRTVMELGHVAQGRWTSLRRGRRPRRAATLMIQDDGNTILVAVDGRQVLGGPLEAEPVAAARGVDLGPGWDRDALIVVPRQVSLPNHLQMGRIWRPEPCRSVTSDPLRGEGELVDHTSRGSRWRQVEGKGTVHLGPDGAQVNASHDRPSPGRSLFTLPWSHPGVEVSVTITPPRGQEGEIHRCRAGVVIKGDKGCQLVVATYLDDWYVGNSLSSFVTVDGKELFYRAVWTNVAHRITWGRPYQLSVTFDGDQYLARIDGEPVLYRRISDVAPSHSGFRPTEVGLAVNEEFGCDTGSRFSDLTLGTLQDD